MDKANPSTTSTAEPPPMSLSNMLPVTNTDLLVDKKQVTVSKMNIEDSTKKKRTFKRKQPPLPDEYKQLNRNISKAEKEKHSIRWIKAQEMRRGLIRPQRKNNAMKLLKYTSHTYYNNLWAEAQLELRALLKEEKARGVISLPDKRKMFSIVSEVYYKYLQLYKKMDETYDQMVHPQKRILVKKLLDLIMARLLETRDALVATEQSEYLYFDELCFLEKIPPENLEIPIPKYYFYDPPDTIKQREKWYENIKLRKEKEEEDRLEAQRKLEARLAAEEKWAQMSDEGPNNAQDSKFSDEASMIMIQRMERARQGKIRYRITKYMSEEEQRAMTKKKKAKKKMDFAKAVLIVQKVVRGFIARARVRRMRQEELELLGLKFPSPGDQSEAAKALAKCNKNEQELAKAKEKRRTARRRNQKIYEEAQVAIQSRLRLLEGPEMAERFKHQIRTWMLWVKETKGKLPVKIPKPEQGGSRFWICPSQLSEEMLEKGKCATDKEYAKKRKAEKKKEKKKEKKEKKKAQQKAMKGILELDHKLGPPKYMSRMIDANIEYNKIWRGRDESGNPEQKHEEQFIIHEKRRLIGDEVRDAVDVALVSELVILKEALEGKKKKKKKKKHDDLERRNTASAVPTKIRLKAVKTKSYRKKDDDDVNKKKRRKDLTKDVPMEELFQQLVDKGIIRKYPEVRFDTFIGTPSLINGEIRSFWEQNPSFDAKKNEERPMPGDANPLPSFGDTKRVLKDLCILPMGSKEIHKMTPHTKSILICGPEGVGKRTLVNAICTELHATMIDLTASNICKKYPGKKGLKMLMHLVDKVGRAVVPTVVKIDNCEKTYLKKTPKGDKTEPKRLKRKLGDLIAHFTGGDQMLLLGTSSEPWMSSKKFMRKDYQKVVYIPRPDYQTRMEMWRHYLIPFANYLFKDVHFSLLTKLSDGYTIGNIKKVVTTIISEHEALLEKEENEKKFRDDEPWMLLETGGKKVSSVGKKSIKMEKFVAGLVKCDPVFVEQEKLWMKYFNDTPLQKLRLEGQVTSAATAALSDKKGKRGT